VSGGICGQNTRLDESRMSERGDGSLKYPLAAAADLAGVRIVNEDRLQKPFDAPS
jgi:hypothetical protein